MHDPTDGRKNPEEPEPVEEESHDDESESSNLGGVNLADLKKDEEPGEEEPGEEEVLRLGRDPKPRRSHRRYRDLREALEAHRRLFGPGGAAVESVVRAWEEKKRHEEILGVGGAAAESVRRAFALADEYRRDEVWREGIADLAERERLLFEQRQSAQEQLDRAQRAAEDARAAAPWLTAATMDPVAEAARTSMDFQHEQFRRQARQEELQEIQAEKLGVVVERISDLGEVIGALVEGQVVLTGEVAAVGSEMKNIRTDVTTHAEKSSRKSTFAVVFAGIAAIGVLATYVPRFLEWFVPWIRGLLGG